MTEPITTSKIEGFNPVLALSIIIGVSMVMVAVTFTIFVRSSAYATVKQIDKGQSIVHALDKSDIDTTSPIKANDIDEFAKTVDERLRTLDDAKDFSASDVSNQSLGF